MMRQIPFADAEYAGKCKQNCKELYLVEMDLVIPCKGFDCPDRTPLPVGLGWPSCVSADGDAVCALDARLVWLQRSGDGRGAVRNDILRQLFGLKSGANSR